MNWKTQTNLEIQQHIGYAIRDRRIHLKMDQKKLSELSGISVNTLNRVENGKTSIKLDNLLSLLKVLGLIEVFEKMFERSVHISLIGFDEMKDTHHVKERYRKSNKEKENSTKNSKNPSEWKWEE